MELCYNLMWWLSLMMDFEQISLGESALSALWRHSEFQQERLQVHVHGQSIWLKGKRTCLQTSRSWFRFLHLVTSFTLRLTTQFLRTRTENNAGHQLHNPRACVQGHHPTQATEPPGPVKQGGHKTWCEQKIYIYILLLVIETNTIALSDQQPSMEHMM